MSQQISFLPADLLDGIDPAAVAARRLLVTAWVFSDGIEEREEKSSVDAVDFWKAHARRIDPTRWATATVPTVLFELIELGLVQDFEDVPGGFDVALVVHEAA